MNSNYLIYLLPIIAAFIGYITNWVAVKMLFHPKKAINFYLFKIQGVFPKRQNILASKLGEVVSRELIDFEDIKKSLQGEDLEKEILKFFEEKIDMWIREKLVAKFPMLAMFLNNELIQKIKNSLLEELEKNIPSMLEHFMATLEKKADIKKIVTKKVEQFSSDKLEVILMEILKKEFKTIEVIGGVLGFVIGLIQVLLIKAPYLF